MSSEQMPDPRVEALVQETLQRWAGEPCECAARAARTEFPLRPSAERAERVERWRGLPMPTETKRRALFAVGAVGGALFVSGLSLGWPWPVTVAAGFVYALVYMELAHVR